MRDRAASILTGLATLLLLSAAPRAAAHEGSPREISKDLTDPVSTTWSLKVKNRFVFLDFAQHSDPFQYELKFQPTMPALLTRDLKLIARPEFTLLDSKPFLNGQDELRRTTGVGDTVFDLVLSPVLGPWLLALGPTFVFPTANLDATGQGKWQAGPAGVAGYRAKAWLAGIIARQWWSFAGSSSRATVSEMHLQYIAEYYFASGWSIGTTPTIEVNWRAQPGDSLTLPFGPTVGKVVSLFGVPLKVLLELQYSPIRPNNGGQQYLVELSLVPTIPDLLPEPLFGASP